MAVVASTGAKKQYQDDDKKEHWGLFLEDFLDLADLLLDRAGKFLDLALGSQIGAIRNLSGLLLCRAFEFVKRAFDLILRARFRI
jgi:hypothetical protein